MRELYSKDEYERERLICIRKDSCFGGIGT